MWGGPNYFFSRVGGDVSPRKYIVATPVCPTHQYCVMVISLTLCVLVAQPG